jgi:hypothetical protein
MPLLAWSPDTGTDLRRGKLSGGDPPDPVRGSVELPRHRRLPGRRWRLDRWRAVYRSDSLSFLTPGDLPAFDALGIKAIYDLRRSGEIAAHPGPHEYVHIELANRDPLEDGKSAGLVTRRDGERWLLADYRRMLASGAVTFGELFSRLAAPGRLPAVIHCLADKDRTGLTVALLLTALGVPRLVVLDDYQLTNDYRGVAHSPQVVALLSRPAWPARRRRGCSARRGGCWPRRSASWTTRTTGSRATCSARAGCARPRSPRSGPLYSARTQLPQCPSRHRRRPAVLPVQMVEPGFSGTTNRDNKPGQQKTPLPSQEQLQLDGRRPAA